MIKVAFHISNPSHSNVDYSSPSKGNPGIGGTEYMIWLFSYLLSVNYSDMEPWIFANQVSTFPPEVHCQQIDDLMDALQTAHAVGIQIFVCVFQPDIPDAFFSLAETLGMKIIVYAHNFQTDTAATRLAKQSCVKRNVCVSREQYEGLCDHRIFKKSAYVYNTILFDPYDDAVQTIPRNSDPSVCYIGSLNPGKGFHYLARIWPEIEKQVPDAQLYVLGSGSLYNKDAVLGSYGLADTEYEKQFMPYLLDEHGAVKDNVHFLGVVGGIEKINLMRSMQVGIVNPSPIGTGETFCIGAIEFAALGVPVVSIHRKALVDTVFDGKSGFLFHTMEEFISDIVRLLTDHAINERMSTFSYDWIRKAFSPEECAEKWHSIITDVANDIPAVQTYQMHHMDNNRKRLRVCNHVVKHILPFLPSIMWYEEHLSPMLQPLKLKMNRILRHK